MAQAGHTHDESQYYIPHGSRLPFFGSIALFILMAGAAATLNGAAAGSWVLGLGLLRALHAVLPLVRRGDPREPGRPLQRAGGPLVPHGDDVVHLLRGHVLRRVLRRAVLRATAVDSLARRRRRQGGHEPAVAGLRRRLAQQRPRRPQPARRRQLRDHPGLRPAGDQHGAAAHLRPHDHDRAPRAEERAPRDPQGVPGG